MADGGSGGRRGQNVFSVVLLGLGQRVEDAWLDDPHDRVGPVLEGPDLDHLDHLVLRLFSLRQRLPGLLQVVF